jgi:aldose 1-epimerase
MSGKEKSGERRFALSNAGVTIEVIEYGARLVRCMVPDANGVLADVVPGLNTAEDYRNRGGTMGAILGRYGNRIGFGRVTLDGRTYELSRNDGEHTMHGGAGHFGTRRWHGEQISTAALRLRLVSEEGDQGWPGRVEAEVLYRLDTTGALFIGMSAISDRRTYLNMIFHGYWNLAGHGSGSVLDHLLRVAADAYLPKDETGLPTGVEAEVEGTPFDFRDGRRIGQRIEQTGRGYAHNLCLRNFVEGRTRPVARLVDPGSGRALELSADQAGVQLFTANSWSRLQGKDEAVYDAHCAIALETQSYPNTPNTPAFSPRPVEAGETYRHSMRISFKALMSNKIAAFLDAPMS